MIVYKNGRLVREQDDMRAQQASEAMKASAIRTAAKEEGAARLAGLKAAQKTQESALKRIKSDKSPSKFDPETGKIFTPPASVIPPKKSTSNTGAGSAAAGAADKALADAQERRRRYFAGLDAAAALETQGRSATQQALEALAGIYDPQLADVESQRAKQLQLFADAITQGQTSISDAEAQFLRDIVVPTAYENVPFVGLSQEQNPLLAALQAQGAGTAEIESQRALDAALAQSLKDLEERSAKQLSAADKRYFEALQNAGRGTSLAGRTYLSQRQPEIQTALESQFSNLVNELRTARAKSEADIQSQLQDVLTDAIKTRAETTANYGPLNIPVGPTPATPVVPEPVVPEPVAPTPVQPVYVPTVGRDTIKPFMPPNKKKINALRAIAGLAEAVRAEGR